MASGCAVIGTNVGGIPFIIKNKLSWFFIFPIIFNIVLFTGGWSLVNLLTDSSIELIQNWLSNDLFPSWIHNIVEGFFWIFFKLV